MSSDIKFDVERLLDSLAPGEKREHLRTTKPTGTEGRFWEVHSIGEIEPGSLQWVNDNPRPSYNPKFPIVTMDQLEQPIFEADLEESPVGDFYNLNNELYFLRSTIVECILSLDPDGIEARKAETRGVEPGWEFYLVRMKRRLDAIDISKTNLILEYKKVLTTKEIYGKRVYYPPSGFCLREDIPADIHCFVEPYAGRLLFSTELISCLRSAGVNGLYARHPTTGETKVPEIRLSNFDPE